MKIKNIYILKRGGYKMDKQQFIKSMNLHKKLKEKRKLLHAKKIFEDFFKN